MNRVYYGVAGRRSPRPFAVMGTRMIVRGPSGGSLPGKVDPPKPADVQKLQRHLQDLDIELSKVRADIKELREAATEDPKSKTDLGSITSRVIETGITAAATVVVTLLIRHWWSTEKAGKPQKKAAEEALAGV